METPICVLVQLTAVWSGGGACSRICGLQKLLHGSTRLCGLVLFDAEAIVCHPRLYGLGMLAAGTTVCPGEVLVAAVWFVVAYIAVFATALSICVFIQLSKHFRGH